MIGGNITASIQVRTITENAIGEQVEEWQTVQSIKGWLDMMSADSNSTAFYSKIVDASDVFIADYQPINPSIEPENPSNARAVIDGRTYDIKYIDDPMHLHQQLEIFLKFTGGVVNVS